MEEVLLKTLDFGIRVIELSNYLENENRKFPLIGRLLECGTGIGICMRLSKDMPQYQRENCIKAYKLALEAEFLFGLMVETGVISEYQSRPILSDCRSIKVHLRNLIDNQAERQLNSKNEKER
jgi:hypothetical protein